MWVCSFESYCIFQQSRGDNHTGQGKTFQQKSNLGLGYPRGYGYRLSHSFNIVKLAPSAARSDFSELVFLITILGNAIFVFLFKLLSMIDYT